MKFILASASPRRKELIKFIDENAVILPADIEEILPKNIYPENIAEYFACQKAKHVGSSNPDSIVLGADTVVIIDGKILGKPKDKQDAENMLTLLSGKTHQVITGCCLCFGKKSYSFSVTSSVTFFDLTEDEINAYINTNEPFDKAGAYGIQGKGCLLVKEIKGDYYNVVGLPVAALKRHLEIFKKMI